VFLDIFQKHPFFYCEQFKYAIASGGDFYQLRGGGEERNQAVG